MVFELDVNQWMQKTVRSLLMSIGSSFVSSLMLGFASSFSFDLQIPFKLSEILCFFTIIVSLLLVPRGLIGLMVKGMFNV